MGTEVALAVSVSVEAGPPGWVFLSEPAYPGWNAWLETPMGIGSTRLFEAMGPFQKTIVPGGAWALHLRYEPPSFLWGLVMTLASAAMLAAYWYNRARKGA